MIATFYFTPRLMGLFGTSEFALYILAASMPAYAVIFDFGVGSALTKLVATYTGNAIEHHPRHLARVTMAFYAFIGVLIAGGLILVSHLGPTLLHLGPAQAHTLRTLLIITAVGQALFWPLSTYRHLLAGSRRYDLISRNAMFGTLLTIACNLAVVVFKGTTIHLTVALNAVMIVSAMLNIASARSLNITEGANALYMPARPILRTLLSFSWPVFALQVVDVLFYQQTDRIILGAIVGVESITLYEGAGKFNAVIIMLGGMAVSAIMPLAARMFATDDREANRFLYVMGTRYLIAVLAPIILMGSLFAEPLLVTWLGPNFKGQGVVATTLLLPHIFVCLGLVGDAILIGMGALSKRVGYAVAQAVINVVLSVLLVGRIGILGVAVATAIAHLVDVPFHLALLNKEIGVGWREFIGKTSIGALAVGLPVVLLGASVRFFVTFHSFFAVVFVCAICCVVYWVLYGSTVLNKEERAYLVSLVIKKQG